MKVEDIMTREPAYVDVNNTIKDAANVMIYKDIRHLPVTDGGKIVGLISDRDLQKFALPLEGPVENIQLAIDRLEKDVKELLNGELVFVSKDADISEAARVLVENKVGAVPVVEMSSQELIGIVSYVDILRADHNL